jgi:prolipoprotein diacylglyceryltransferase
MRRILFEWRGLRVWSYPALLYIGMVTGVMLQYAAAGGMGLPPLRVYWATMLLLPIALAGSRVFFLAIHWRQYFAEPARIWRRGEGGLAMYGGVPFMIAASVPILGAMGLPFLRFWDSAVFCIFTGMAFARIGCLLNGCCSGRETSAWFGIRLPDDRGAWARRVPVQLLEGAAALLLLAGCTAAQDRLTTPGTLFLAATAAYASVRLLLQPARVERDYARGIDVQTAFSLALIACAVSGLVLLA